MDSVCVKLISELILNLKQILLETIPEKVLQISTAVKTCLGYYWVNITTLGNTLVHILDIWTLIRSLRQY